MDLGFLVMDLSGSWISGWWILVDLGFLVVDGGYWISGWWIIVDLGFWVMDIGGWGSR